MVATGNSHQIKAFIHTLQGWENNVSNFDAGQGGIFEARFDNELLGKNSTVGADVAEMIKGLQTHNATLVKALLVDLRDRGEAILGTTAQPEAVRASAICAVQNLWLAARAEGLGVGWVSIVEPAVLREELALPGGVEPVAYLCLGPPVAFRARPLLEETGWDRRRRLAEVVHGERWQGAALQAAPVADVPARGAIPPFSERARDEALAHQERLIKPRGSLGRLEEVAAWYAGGRRRFPAQAPRAPALVLFAADHGVVAEGVSAYGSQTRASIDAERLSYPAAPSHRPFVGALTSSWLGMTSTSAPTMLQPLTSRSSGDWTIWPLRSS